MMKRTFSLLYIFAIVAILIFAALNRKSPEPAREIGRPVPMSLPANYRDDFSRYLVVDRPDATVRYLYAHPSVVTAIAAGETIPYGAQIIIETYHAQSDILGNLQRDSLGHFVAGEMFPTIHMMEKRDTWTIADLPSPVGIIDWNFASFYPDGLPSSENRNDCLTCHDSGAFRRDFLFSRSYILAYTETQELQYLYCSLIGRGNCIR